jgi:hypothetical protein
VAPDPGPASYNGYKMDDGELPPTAPETRTVQRGDQVYEQAVSRGKRREAARQREDRATRPAPKPAKREVFFQATIRDQFDVDELANRLVALLLQDERRTLEVEVREG